MKLEHLLLALLIGFSPNAMADEYAISFNPRTGDVWMDVQLREMNVYTRGNPDLFIRDVSMKFGVPPQLIGEYLQERRWAPGDLYYACALAHEVRKPCLESLRDYDRNNGKGWGAIAKAMGIKPGTAQFQNLKGHVSNSNGKFKANGKYKAMQGNGMYRYGAQPQGKEQTDSAQGKDKNKNKNKKGN